MKQILNRPLPALVKLAMTPERPPISPVHGGGLLRQAERTDPVSWRSAHSLREKPCCSDRILQHFVVPQ